MEVTWSRSSTSLALCTRIIYSDSNLRKCDNTKEERKGWFRRGLSPYFVSSSFWGPVFGPSIKYVITFFAIFDTPFPQVGTFFYRSVSTFFSISDHSPSPNLKRADVLYGWSPLRSRSSVAGWTFTLSCSSSYSSSSSSWAERNSSGRMAGWWVKQVHVI